MNWILVPIRNGLHLTKAAHRTFVAQDIPTAVCYIDNGSTDGSAQWLGSLPNVAVFFNAPPRGVAASWNQGLSWLFANGHKQVLVANNDVELRPDTYSTLLQEDAPFVTAVGVGDREMLLPEHKRGVRPHPDFSAYLIRRDCWDKVGPFDENFKGAYAEDADYHLRMHRAGIKAYCIGLPFYHVACGTIKSATKEEGEAISQLAEANRAYFREKYGFDVGSEEYYAEFGHEAPD